MIFIINILQRKSNNFPFLRNFWHGLLHVRKKLLRLYIYTYRSLIYAGVIATYSLAAENLYCVESILKLTRIKARIWVFRQLRYIEKNWGKGDGDLEWETTKWEMGKREAMLVS